MSSGRGVLSARALLLRGELRLLLRGEGGGARLSLAAAALFRFKPLPLLLGALRVCDSGQRLGQGVARREVSEGLRGLLSRRVGGARRYPVVTGRE